MVTPAEKFVAALLELPGHEVSRTTLRVLSKQASDRSFRLGEPLDTALVQTIRDNGEDLTAEHVRRIVEGANTQTHLAQLDGSGGYPVFKVAHPTVVWEGLHPKEPKMFAPDMDYHSSPSELDKVASRKLEAAEREKTAASRPTLAIGAEVGSDIGDPKMASARRVRDACSQANEIYDSLKASASWKELAAGMAREKIASAAKQELWSGTSPEKLRTVLSAVDATRWGNRVWEGVASLLGDEFPTIKTAKLLPSLEGVPDQRHPAVRAFGAAVAAEKESDRHKLAAQQALPAAKKAKALKVKAVLGGLR